MLADAWWPGGRPEFGGGSGGSYSDELPTDPLVTNGPPAVQANILADNWHVNGMAHFLVNRHGGTTDIVFVDNSVRSVSLKELYGLRWNKSFQIRNNYTKQNPTISIAWPDFMKNCKDFYNW